ncbi:hypothetical protein FE257_003862 [Aspergillus nanangensis]|uniref:Uncharacterized protein n=1 Tax=Aspergillus nanangensis TaxID=2582783 RepID=A0AAD4CB47_ASPNN|nr:hypothetical protein FE257_003862 [Aspergillus nanangensis]
MAIDSLLNPPEHNRASATFSSTNSPSNIVIKTDRASPRMQYAPPPSQYSPLYPPSPNHYFYASYPDSTTGSNHRLPAYRESSHDAAFLPYRPRSTESSPGAYSRDRYDSVSSSSSNAAAERRRPPRPKYEEEEMYFIWYHRVDLCQEWKEVRESFNRQFPNRQRRGFQGIQCKFYRFIKEKKCPTLREQRRMRDGEFLREGSGLVDSAAPRFGVIEWAGQWYPWMRESKDQVMTMTQQLSA